MDPKKIQENVARFRETGIGEPDEDGTYKLPGHNQDGHRLGEEGVVCSDLKGAIESIGGEVAEAGRVDTEADGQD